MASEDEPTQIRPRATRRRSTRAATTVEDAALPVDTTGPTEAAEAAEAAGPADTADPGVAGVAGEQVASDPAAAQAPEPAQEQAPEPAPVRAPTRRTRKRAVAAAATPAPAPDIESSEPADDVQGTQDAAQAAQAAQAEESAGAAEAAEDQQATSGRRRPPTFGLLFQPPAPPPARTPRRRAAAADADPEAADHAPAATYDAADDEAGDDDSETARRRRRRGGKGRRRAEEDGAPDAETDDPSADEGDTATHATDGSGTSHGGDGAHGSDGSDDDNGEAAQDEAGASGRKRTRRRRRSGASPEGEDPPGTVTKVREPRRERDEATGIRGSTRLEAKKQRRREGREAGRRRTVITEAEFLARRESVERVMVVRQRGERTQIGVLEDGVLVEHYVSTAGAGQGGANGTGTSLAGNVYLGRVQNVLPSMEAAFIDIGKGRNAVLYAGEVNWDAAGLESNKNRRIEQALSSGQGVLVQVTKDPIGHKGARLTSQVSLPGRFLVYVPDGSMTGISRKLPDTERTRLKKILREIVPDNAGVIVRTAAEGASDAELTADVERLTKIWEGIQKKATSANAPALLHGEVDLTVRVIRDVFNEDFASLVVAGEQAWATINEYVESVAPDLAARVTKWTGTADVFADYRIDEQLAKAMDRKVWLPSGGSLVIDRTEAMTVVDVNTGKFVGSGGNLEETVTKNNIEAAEEIVRQLRLRDIGGIIVIDFIDMVLEINRDLVVRRLLECLGRDRTKHQVAEVTSLGLVQMTRKRVGAGLIEVFSQPCEHCNGRGLLVRDEPVERTSADSGNGGSSGNSGSSGGASGGGGGGGSAGRGRGRRSRGGAGGQNAQDQGAQHANAGNGDNAGHPGNTGHAGTGGSGGAASGPTPAQIAAQAYAAALHAAGHDADHSADHAAHHSSDRAPEQADEAPLPSSITGPDAEPDADVVEPSGGPGYPAPRARRKRGRVVAPAGPPRSQDDDGGDATPQSAASPEPAVSPEPAEPAEPTESPA